MSEHPTEGAVRYEVRLTSGGTFVVERYKLTWQHDHRMSEFYEKNAQSRAEAECARLNGEGGAS